MSDQSEATEEVAVPLEVVEAPEVPDREGIVDALLAAKRDLDEATEEANAKVSVLNDAINAHNTALAKARAWFSANQMPGLAEGDEFSDLTPALISIPEGSEIDHAGVFNEQFI